MKKIRILNVAQAAGGVDRYIRMLLKYLDKDKFENVLVCSQDFHEEDYKGLVISFEQIEMTRAIGGNDLKAIKEVRALIKKYKPDIVYAHSSKAGAIARVADIGLRNHCVYNPHTYMVIASGMIGYFKLDKFSSVSLKELLHFSMPIVPSSIALWVVNLSDRLIIIHFMGAAANGIYAVANKIPSLYSTAYGIFNLAWTETASKVSDDGNPAEYYTKLFSGLFKFLIGVMLALIAVTPIIFSVLVKGDYGAAFFQVPILYFGIFFNSLVNFYSGIYIALKRTKQVGYSSVAGAIINAAINVLLIRIIGLYAASISTAVSFFVIAIYRAIDLNKIIEIKYNKKEIEIGRGLFLISTICLNCNQVWTIVLCWGIAGIYNITQNMQIAKRIIGKFLKK